MADVRGVVVTEGTPSPPPIRLPEVSNLGIIGTAPGARADGKFSKDGKIAYNQPFLITSRQDASALELGTEGTLPDALNGIFNQTRARIVFSIIEDVPTRVGIAAFNRTQKATPGTTIANFNLGALATGRTGGLNDRALAADERILTLNADDSSTPDADAFLELNAGQIIKIEHDSGGTGTGEYELISLTTSQPGGGTVTQFAMVVREINALAPAIAADDIVSLVFEAVDGEQSTRANAVGDAGEGTGVYSLLNAESVTGVRPNLIMATGLGTGRQIGGNKNPIGAALEAAATRLRGIALIAGPNTTHEEAITFAGDYGSDRVYLIDPFVRVAKGLEIVDQDPTAHIAGLIVRNDAEGQAGWANSPSNELINGILGTSRPIDYVAGDAASRAELLNAAGIATIINIGGGYRLWGGQSPAAADRATWKFINVRRISDVLYKAIQDNHLWAVDRGITPTYFEAVAEGVNALIRTLKNQDALINGVCYPDQDLNSAANIAQGKVFFNVEYTPVFPARTVSFNVTLDTAPLEEII